ncbi:MAG: hypothetical protein MMC33_007418 [Icmadophila ericetorum]|nr:hypothetical protein [Icmadophila ericetorum]
MLSCSILLAGLFFCFESSAAALGAAAVQKPLQYSTTESRDRYTWLACRVIEGHLPGAVSYPGDLDYTDQQKHYWLKQQALLHPICRVSPTVAEDIPIILKEISVFNVPFAIKSGGHSFVSNVSNIDRGLTIDLDKLDSVEIHGKAVIVGPGARWRQVYKVLDGFDLSVVGARAGNVGVGGYLLGGGNSWFSGRAGWACDSIESLEIVLVNGSIIEVDKYHHPDLYKALKGGGGNLGIITRFVLKVHKQQEVLTSNIEFEEEAIGDIFQTLEDFDEHAAEDPDVAVLPAVVFTAPENFYASIMVVQTKDNKKSPLLKRFQSIPHIYSRSKRVRMGTLTSWGEEGGGPYTEYKATLTIKNNATLLGECFKIFKSLMDPSELLKDIAYRTAITVQPLTTQHLIAGREAGGNILGFSDKDGPLQFISIETRFSNTSRFAHHAHTTDAFISQCDAKAVAMNLSHPFVYLNYASEKQAQDVYRGYGNESLELLRSVREKYDPQNVFGRLKAGPFKF